MSTVTTPATVLPAESRGAWSALAMLVGRVVVVAALLPNGIRKIATFDLTSAMMGGAPPALVDGRLFPAQTPLFYFPVPGLFLSFSIAFDLIGATLIILGLRTRPVAAFLAAYCMLAMTIYHGNIVTGEDLRQVLRNLPLVGGLLLLAGGGAGAWSVDGWRSGRRGH